MIRLPGCYQPHDSTQKIADRIPTRAEEGLPEGAYVYCCFNNNYKITPEIFDVWMEILKEVPDSVLWLYEGNAAAPPNLRKEAEKRGVDPDRLIFAKKKPIEEHLARHQLADLFLDTIPCNAHTTARDALTAGLPVLTLMGDTFASRVAASIGQTTDGGVHVAESIDAYKQLAISKPVIALGAPQVTKSNFVAEFEKALNRMAEGVTRNKGSCIRQELASDAPLFEVVVTGLRLGEFFEECLASIGQQSYRQFRVHLLSIIWIPKTQLVTQAR